MVLYTKAFSDWRNPDCLWFKKSKQASSGLVLDLNAPFSYYMLTIHLFKDNLWEWARWDRYFSGSPLAIPPHLTGDIPQFFRSCCEQKMLRRYWHKTAEKLTSDETASTSIWGSLPIGYHVPMEKTLTTCLTTLSDTWRGRYSLWGRGNRGLL